MMNHIMSPAGSGRTHVGCAWRLLYATYIILPIVAGLDKFFNYLVNWNIYLHPSLSETLGISPELFLYSMGIIEISGGILVFFRPRLGGYVVTGLLIAIVIDLLSLGYYDIAVRDIGLAAGAYALALLSAAIGQDEAKKG